MGTPTRAKTARLLAGLSTAQLADRAKLNRTSYIRLEKEQYLSASQTERLAAATGIPTSFYMGRGFTGLVVARPGRFVGTDAARQAYEYLAANLPALVDGAFIRQVKSADRSADIADTSDYCLVILPADNVALLPENCHTPHYVPEKLLSAAFDSDSGIPELLERVGLRAFTPSKERYTTATLTIRTSDDRSAVDSIMILVDKMRLAGHDVDVQIKSGVQQMGYETGYENSHTTKKGATLIA